MSWQNTADFCKIEGAEEEIITIRDIRVLKEEQKFYEGINAKKHWCEAEHNGVMMRFFWCFIRGLCLEDCDMMDMNIKKAY